MKMEESKSKKTSQKNHNGNIVVSLILLGGALMTAAVGAFLVERKRRKSSRKKEKNEEEEEESSKGLHHFLLPHSSPCMHLHMHHPSSNGTEKLGVNDATSLFSTIQCLIQDEKLEMDDEKGEGQNATVSDHPKQEEKSQLELSEVKTSLLPDTNRVSSEVSQGNEEPHLHQAQDAIFYHPSFRADDKSEFLVDKKDNAKGELSELQHEHTDMIKTENHDEGLIQERENQEIFSPDDSCRQEILPIQLCSQPLFQPEPLNSVLEQEGRAIATVELKKADYEDEDKGNMHFEEQHDAETESDHFASKRNQQMEFSDAQNCPKENNQANSSLENSPYSMVVQNLAASAISNALSGEQHTAKVIKGTNAMDTATGGEQSLEAEYSPTLLVEKQSFEPDIQGNCAVVEKDVKAHSREAEYEVAESVRVYEEKEDDNVIDKDAAAAAEVEDGISEGGQDVESIVLLKTDDEDEEDKGHKQIMYFQDQLADTDSQTDQIAKKCNLQMQVIDEQKCCKEKDKANSCYEGAISENSSCGTDSMAVQNLAASTVRKASLDDQHCAEEIKETNTSESNDQISAEVIQDIAANTEQRLEAKNSPIQLVEKQNFETDYQGNGLEEDKRASETLATDIAVVDKDLEEHSKEAEDKVVDGVSEDGKDDDDSDKDIDKDDDAEEINDDISKEAGNSSNSDKLWPADSNQELLLVLNEKRVEKEEEGMKFEEDETSSVKNCDLKRIQNGLNKTRNYDDSAVNVYRTKLMHLDDVAAIPGGAKMLLGALLALIWYLCVKTFIFPALVDSRF